MANIKSSIKRAKTNEKARLRNKAVKTNVKTAVRNVREAIESGSKEDATELFRFATKRIDMAVTKGVIHKNTAARKKSSLARSLNAMSE